VLLIMLAVFQEPFRIAVDKIKLMHCAVLIHRREVLDGSASASLKGIR
jgi:hypothetical protein